jgi:hypothetical protein
MEHNLPGCNDEDTILHEAKIFLLNIQEEVDHYDVAKILIENDLHDGLIEWLQVDNFSIG